MSEVGERPEPPDEAHERERKPSQEEMARKEREEGTELGEEREPA